MCNDSHYLQNFVEHNHGSQASNAEVAKITAHIKRQASETRDKPAKIIQDNVISMSEEVRPYIPSLNALRRTISHVRRLELPPQPQNITEVDIPESLCLTLNGSPFLVKDYMVGQEQILLFTTRENIRHLLVQPFGLWTVHLKPFPQFFIKCIQYTCLLVLKTISEFSH